MPALTSHFLFYENFNARSFMLQYSVLKWIESRGMLRNGLEYSNSLRNFFSQKDARDRGRPRVIESGRKWLRIPSNDCEYLLRMNANGLRTTKNGLLTNFNYSADFRFVEQKFPPEIEYNGTSFSVVMNRIRNRRKRTRAKRKAKVEVSAVQLGSSRMQMFFIHIEAKNS